MIFDILQILIWVTTIMLTISGLDDLYVDLLYWVLKRKHKNSLPDFSEMYDKPEKPIAIMLGAWNESGVIGRTLSFAVNNLRYTNYRFFVGVYPNDQKTIDVVSKISEADKRVKMVINPQNGPSTKADNLNCLYSAISEFEKKFGEFEIILVHDAEDFIHPRALKLYNYLIGYKGYHGIQIPVVPIKSQLGNTIHRTYCDAFAETHTKDMIIRQELKTFLPFSGTGMGFHRKSMYCIEKHNAEALIKAEYVNEQEKKAYVDPFGRIVEVNNDYFLNLESQKENEYFNNTHYKDNPFEALKHQPSVFSKTNKRAILSYTIGFVLFVISGLGLYFYTSSSIHTSGNSKEPSRQKENLNKPENKTANSLSRIQENSPIRFKKNGNEIKIFL